MKNFLILTSVLTVFFLAVIDTKARIEEIDEISAITPAQVEMKSELNQSKGEGVLEKFDINEPQTTKNAAEPTSIPLQTQKNKLTPHPMKTFTPKKESNVLNPQMP